MTDFTYLSYEPVVFGSVLPMTYVSTVEYSPIRRAYIDSLISSLIDLHTEPQVVYYIDRLKECRNREWDAEVLKLVNDAMTVYNRRYIYLNGGGQEGGALSDTVGKIASKYGSKFANYAKKIPGKATQGFKAAFGKSDPNVPLGKTAQFFRRSAKGLANLTGLREKGTGNLSASSMMERGVEKGAQALEARMNRPQLPAQLPAQLPTAAPAAGGMYGGEDYAPTSALELEQALALEQARLQEDMARLQRYA